MVADSMIKQANMTVVSVEDIEQVYIRVVDRSNNLSIRKNCDFFTMRYRYVIYFREFSIDKFSQKILLLKI